MRSRFGNSPRGRGHLGAHSEDVQARGCWFARIVTASRVRPGAPSADVQSSGCRFARSAPWRPASGLPGAPRLQPVTADSLTNRGRGPRYMSARPTASGIVDLLEAVAPGTWAPGRPSADAQSRGCRFARIVAAAGAWRPGTSSAAVDSLESRRGFRRVSGGGALFAAPGACAPGASAHRCAVLWLPIRSNRGQTLEPGCPRRRMCSPVAADSLESRPGLRSSGAPPPDVQPRGC